MAQSNQPSEGLPKGPQAWQSRLQQLRQEGQQNLEEGAVTSGYRANREEILDLLNRAVAGEWSSFLQYEHHYIMASDIHSAEIADMWKEHADEERDHALKINERIDQLGGVPANDPKQIVQLTPTPFVAGTDMRSMLEIDLAHERATIAFYNDIIRTCGFDDNETRAIFEDILLDENEHANEIAHLLFHVDASTGKPIPSVHESAIKGGQTRATGR